MGSKNGASVLKQVITRDDVAELLVMSDRNVSRLTKLGVLPKGKNGYVLGDVVPRFVEHQRDEIANVDPHESIYRAARARKMQALATSEEMRVKLQRGELLEREHIMRKMTFLLLAVRNHLLSLASRISRELLPHVANEDKNANFQQVHAIVNDQVHAALNEATELRIDDALETQRRRR